MVHGLDDGAQDVAQAHEDGGQDEEHPYRRGNRDILRDHFAEDDVTEQHDDEGCCESDDVAGRLGSAQAFQRRLDEVRNRRFGDDAQRRGGDRDAQLADGEHEGDVLQRVERISCTARAFVGERLNLRAPR